RASTKALNENIAATFPTHPSAQTVFEHAKKGDELCQHVIKEWSREVAKGIAQIILLIDPDTIVIGGGISAQGDYLLQQVEAHLPKFLPDNFLKTNLEIATLKNNAALYGTVYPFINNQ